MADEEEKKLLHGKPPVIFSRTKEPHRVIVPLVLVADPVFVRRQPDGSYKEMEQIDERIYRAAIESFEHLETFKDSLPENPAPNGQIKKLTLPPPPPQKTEPLKAPDGSQADPEGEDGGKE